MLEMDRQTIPSINTMGVHILTGLALALFVLLGFLDAVNHGPLEVLLLIPILALSVLLLATLDLAQKRFGVATLITGLGLIIMAGNHLLKFVYGYDDFEGYYYFTPVQLEAITYSALALVLAKRTHLLLSILAPGLAAILDIVVEGVSVMPTWAARVGLTDALSFIWNRLSESWWRYALLAIMCGLAGIALGLVLKRVKSGLAEEAILSTILAVILLFVLFSHR